MSDDIAPALTPDEWVGEQVGGATEAIGALTRCDRITGTLLVSSWSDGDLSVEQRDNEESHCLIHRASRHALAAIALHGQPFGFTPEDVVRLRDWRIGALHPGHAEWSTGLLARIAALLPPPSV